MRYKPPVWMTSLIN